MIEETKYYGVYESWRDKKRMLFTKSQDGKNFFNELMFDDFLEFDPRRSKLGAAIVKRISFFPIKNNSKILYLGAAHGYTPSKISDIATKGVIYCLDFAPRVVRDLYFICEERENMIPLLADANDPDSYANRIEQVDIIYEDVAQKTQIEILFKNLRFLKNNGYVMIAVKARSIDVTRRPQEIFDEVERKLNQKLKVIDKKLLDPLEKDHCFFVCQKK
ncbi:MAG: fibrillarin-like rRNA/tRNA 2'-O-methyltransferase [Candidatus Nanoarchaeia archaeon]|nr:fibrillarin-like rRNA/tRNA 2'-O-methyltransferase [Candidatus Nanoarchaeia archaeon]